MNSYRLRPKKKKVSAEFGKVTKIKAAVILREKKIISDDGIVSFEIKGDWNLGSLPVKGMRLRFTDDLHQELLPDLFDPDTAGTLPPERYEFILEATVKEVTKWYEQTLEIEYIKPSEQTIDDVVRPIYIFDHTEYYKNKWPEVKAITSLACTPIY